jgi:GT2 family glycosyltransferase
MKVLYDVLKGFPVKHYMENGHFAPTCCLTVKSQVFDRIGSFDGRLRSGGDTEFGNRAWEAGMTFRYAGEVSLRHPARGTARALLAKAIRVGRDGRGGVAHLYPDRYGYLNRYYLSYRNYLPTRPWTVRRNYRCGYAFKTRTVMGLAVLPALINLASLGGFLQSRIRYLFDR